MTRVRLPERVVLQDFFENLAEQLQQFSSAAYGIEGRVGEVISDGIHGGDRLRTTLQGLDHLAQTANYLAIFIESLSRSADANQTIGIAGHIELVGLRSLAESLVGHGPSGHVPHESIGDVDLF